MGLFDDFHGRLPGQDESLASVQEQKDLERVKGGGLFLPFIKEQTPEMYLEATKKYSWALKYIKEQTPEICLSAVKQNGGVLKHVKEQTLEICLAAVEQNGLALRYVKEQTPEVCMVAVQQCGEALQYVEHQTPEICLAAVRQSGEALRFVKEQTHEICMAAVQQSWFALRYVEHQTPEICMAAIQQRGVALQYVEKQTPEICLAAVQQNPEAIECIRDQEVKKRLEKVIQGWTSNALTDNNKTDKSKIATIKKTNFGYGNHGILTASLLLEVDSGTECWFGSTLSLDYRDANSGGHKVYGYAADYVKRILEIANKDSWEELVGIQVRVLDNADNPIYCVMGSLDGERWLDVREYFDVQSEVPTMSLF